MLGIGIIGTGHGLNVHAPALSRTDGLDLRAVVSKRLITIPDVDILSSTEELCLRPDIDIILVATPPASHAAITLMALNHGKAVLCEKPMGLSMAECEQILQAAKQEEVKIAVGFQFRFEPALQQLKALIFEGTLGSVERINVDWFVGGAASRTRPWDWQFSQAAGGGVTLNFATHALDYLSWLTGGMHSVSFKTGRIIVPERRYEDTMQAVDCDDSVDYFLKATSGVEINLRINNQCSHSFGHRITVFGSKACAELSWTPPYGMSNSSLNIFTDGNIQNCEIKSDIRSEKLSDTRILPTVAMWKAFGNYMITGNIGDLASVEDTLNIHQLLIEKNI